MTYNSPPPSPPPPPCYSSARMKITTILVAVIRIGRPGPETTVATSFCIVTTRMWRWGGLCALLLGAPPSPLHPPWGSLAPPLPLKLLVAPLDGYPLFFISLGPPSTLVGNQYVDQTSALNRKHCNTSMQVLMKLRI